MTGILKRILGKNGASVPFCSAVVPAAGSANRMEGQDKILTMLGGIPLLVHTLRALEDSTRIHEIIVVTRPELLVELGQLCKDFCLTKVRKVVVGGDSRTKSVLAGVRETNPKAELIAIHDGARPLATAALIDAVILRAGECGAAAPAVPVKDTIKVAHSGLVETTPDRSTLFAVQTPQVFQASLIHAALQQVLEAHAVVTDDCSAVERLGMTVALTQGSYENIKITTPTDVWIAEGILAGRANL